MDKNLKSIIILLIIAFFEGAFVMAIELLGAKLIAPTFGTSLYVWSATLAITLFALTFGYLLGGLLSEKKNRVTFLAYSFLIAGVLTLFMPKISDCIIELVLRFDLKTGIIVSLLCFMFIPLLLLGLTSPIIISEIVTYKNKAGKFSGIVYAVSTFGGIFSSFSVGFYFISNYGIRVTCFYTGMLLLIMPLLLLYTKKKSSIICILLLLSAMYYYENKIVTSNINLEKNINLLYKNEGLLGEITVFDINKENRILAVNNTYQTAYNLNSKKALWEYVHRIATYSSLKQKNSKALICGLGGGVLANEFNALGFKIDVCDFDARTEFVAKKYFNLTTNATVIIDDARHFIKKTETLYDIIVLDLSYGENIAANMYTIESFKEIKKKLTPTGFLFLHFVNKSNDNYVINSIYLTMKAAGFYAQFLNTKNNNTNSSENMLFATTFNLNLEKQFYSRVSEFSNEVFKIPQNYNVYSKNNILNGEIFIDDKPKAEMLFANSVLMNRKKLIIN